MARPKRKTEEGSNVPTWIVSFSDMVTLLLAFFVLLQSFAHVQDPDLFFVGQGSFKSAIAGLGIPSWLWGREDKPRRDHIQLHHPMEPREPAHPKQRIIDADSERIREMFADLKKQLETSAVDLWRETIRVEVTPIRFDAPRAELNAEARQYLQQFVLDVRQTVQVDSLRFYVIGLAADAAEVSQQWRLSAQRARAAEAYLDRLLSAGAGGKGWSVYSWGAGAGGPWCRQHGFLPGQTHVVIVVVKEKVQHG